MTGLPAGPRYFVDLFACQGGCSVGYHQALHAAGIIVLGVDRWDKYDFRKYPFHGAKGDVLEVLQRFLAGESIRFYDRRGYALHVTLDQVIGWGASPPCQRYSAGTRGFDADDYPDLVEPTRALLQATGLPYIIENVAGAPLEGAVLLCGSMFGLFAEDEDGFPLYLERHRLFEANFPITAPGPCEHPEGAWAAGIYGGARGRAKGQTASEHRFTARHVRKGGYVPDSLAVRQRLMGITWADPEAMAQMIPPAYTAHLGRLLADHLTLTPGVPA